MWFKDAKSPGRSPKALLSVSPTFPSRFPWRLLASLVFLGWTAHSQAQVQITLAWNPSPTPDVTGYSIYYGPATGTYNQVVRVGNTNTATIPDLIVGQTYYFVATAVDSSGLESGYSNEISYTPVASGPTLHMSVAPTGQVNLSGSGTPGYQYEVLVSGNLIDWTAMGTITADATGSLSFSDPTTSGSPMRFYRLQQVPP